MHIVQGVDLLLSAPSPRRPPEMVACPLFVYCCWLQAAPHDPQVIANKTGDELLLDELVPGKDAGKTRLSPLAAAAFRGNTALFDEVIKMCQDKDKQWDLTKVGRDY